MEWTRRFPVGPFGGVLMLAGFLPLLAFASSNPVALAVGVVIVVATLLAVFRDPALAWGPGLAWLPWFVVLFVQRVGVHTPGLTGWPLPWGWFVGSIGAGCVAATSLAGRRWSRRTWVALLAITSAALCASLLLPAVGGEAAYARLDPPSFVVLALYVVWMCLQVWVFPINGGGAALFWLGMAAVFLLMLLSTGSFAEAELSPPAWIAALVGGMLAFFAGLVARLERRGSPA